MVKTSAFTMDAEQERREEFLEEEQPFRANAFKIIEKMVELDKENSSDQTTKLVNEVIHSIFFLGRFNLPPFSPEEIVNEEKKLQEWKERYPLPFDLYSSQLPRRSPFSCVLDMVLHLTEHREGEGKKEEVIIQKLQEIISPLSVMGRKIPLVSSTICVSHTTKDPKFRHYGVSMSTSGANAGRIMIAASCFAYWDSYVADAVMTYYPEKVKKPYFDGTIKLPEHVRCQAFKIRGGTKDPCRSCGNLFGFEKSDTYEWDYGHCAEAESVSNLLKNVEKVREQVKPTSEKYTEENRRGVKEGVLKELKRLLKIVKFKKRKYYDFYIPEIIDH